MFALTLTGAVVGWALTGPHTPERTELEWGTLVRANVRHVPAGCGPLALVTSPSVVQGWVDVDGVLPYDTVPPAAGWMLPTPPADGERSPRPEAVVREMWDGANVIWLAADADEALAAQVDAMVEANPQWGARVYRWPAGREKLEGKVAFATWGATQTCQVPVAEVAAQVFAATSGAPGATGKQPPPLRTP